MEDQNQSSENKNFKFKELRVYTSTEWLADNKKKYRQVFDRYETTYIYTELSFYNKFFDREIWEVDIELKCFEIKNIKKQICALNFSKKISKFDNIVYIREGWGNKKEGSFWKKGTYYWEAWIGGEKISTKYFYVEDIGDYSLMEHSIPYISLQSVRLYEGQYDDVIEEDRTYFQSFSSEETRYIYSEIFLKNKIKDENWHCELFVRFYNESRELKGQVTRLQNVKKDDDIIKITAGWGANTKGSWKQGNYSIEVAFMDKLIAVIHFEVGDEYVDGQPDIQIPNRGLTSYINEESGEENFEEVFDKLGKLIGLFEIKQRVRDHARYLEFLKIRKEKGFREKEKIDIHSVFTGNPGTGKTTVAKMMGQLYKKMGLLSKGHVTEVDRADLVGEYIGQTAPKVKEVIEKARGGVLFIDEAYSLARSNDDSKDFGREVIEILVKEMSNGKGDLAVIVAGYPKEMKNFIQSNPGLKSRFKHFFEFSDYLPQELTRIAEASAETREIKFTAESFAIFKEIITSAYRDRDKAFGNARYVQDMLDKAKLNMALRIMNRKNPARLSKIELSEIQVSDVISLKPKDITVPPEIPVDEVLLNQALSDLDKMIGIQNIKTQIREMASLVRYYRETGKNVLSAFSMHTVFVGNPGTGKTTVARIMARIYKALGILERGHIVETDRQGLVAGFIGQTAIKTSEKIDEALGGVLFIDEAYALSNHNGLQGDFGNEAIQTLLKRMEDLRGQFFIFVAGYPDNMDVFLKANPGLNSRFDKTLKFYDYTPEELEAICLSMIDNEGYKLSLKATGLLHQIMTDMYLKRDKYFGNAREVRKIILEVIKNQNLRVSSTPMQERKKNQSNIIQSEDLSTISQIKESELIHKKTIGFRSRDY
ncbi:MAG: AAA family ATPase [Saprospiraceae bacterium]|nr:AAA family ATPase [Saprospiraceae bacterium]MBL0026621.1 AAA family ATPase [Saprospiraceae bacterium]